MNTSDTTSPSNLLSSNEQIIVARTIAYLGHQTQVDKAGRSYIEHVARVVALLPPDCQAAGWLHDVLEDTKYTVDDLRVAGISDDTIADVQLVTKQKNTAYDTYIDALIAAPNNVRALIVKEADLQDHLQPNCPSSLRPRYEAALPKIQVAILKAVLQDRQFVQRT